MSLHKVLQARLPPPNLTCNPTNSLYFEFNYCPSLAAACLFTALYTLSFFGHVFQAIQYRKRFCWVLLMGCAWELISAATRIASIKSPFDGPVSHTTFVFLVLAPLWINAFDYMVLGRMVYYYLPDQKLIGLKAKRFAVVFVTLDITSFIVQLVGALATIGTNTKPSIIKLGLHIYTAGVCLQQAVILGFLLLCVLFQRRMNRESTRDVSRGNHLVFALYISLTLITFRIIFRIIEFSAGADSNIHNTLDNDEWFMYVFDYMPMFFAVVVFNVYHPGRVLSDPESEFGGGRRSVLKAHGEEEPKPNLWRRSRGAGMERDGYELSSRDGA